MFHRIVAPRALSLALAATILSASLLCSGTSPARAQGLADDGFDPSQLDAMTASVHQVPLNEEMIGRLIQSFPEMRKTGAKFAGTELPEKPPAPGSSDLDALPEDKREALETIAKDHGFKDLQDWSDTANTVVMGYIYLAQGKKPGSVDEALRANVDFAERNPNLTPEQKTETIEIYRKIGATLRRLEPTKENYEIILAMKDKLAPIMDPN